MADNPKSLIARKAIKKRALNRWENEGGAPAEAPQKPAEDEAADAEVVENEEDQAGR